MNKYYFKERNAQIKKWYGPYEAINVQRAWAEHMARLSAEFYPWIQARQWWDYAKR